MYRTDFVVVILVIFQAMLAAAIVAEPETLGLNKVIISWMAILNIGVGVALNQLKSVGKKPEMEQPTSVNITNIMPPEKDKDAI